jgi:hypothetical protein
MVRALSTRACCGRHKLSALTRLLCVERPQCQNLPPSDASGLLDPYLIFRFSGQQKTTPKKTRTRWAAEGREVPILSHALLC